MFKGPLSNPAVEEAGKPNSDGKLEGERHSFVRHPVLAIIARAAARWSGLPPMSAIRFSVDPTTARGIGLATPIGDRVPIPIIFTISALVVISSRTGGLILFNEFQMA